MATQLKKQLSYLSLEYAGHAPVLIRHSHVIDCSRKRNALCEMRALIFVCTRTMFVAKDIS